jgi:hypothetical protein
MNILRIIIIIIAVLFVLGILLFLLIAWGLSQGIKKKFGPEWIPGELNINFNYFEFDEENEKNIRYVLSASETDEIVTQIQALINEYDKNTIVKQSKKPRPGKYLWKKCNDETYEFRHLKNDTLKAMLLLNSKELIYFK